MLNSLSSSLFSTFCFVFVMWPLLSSSFSVILLSQPLECWNYGHLPLRIVLCMLQVAWAPETLVTATNCACAGTEKSLGYSDGPILLGFAELPRDLCMRGRVWGLMEVRYLCIGAESLHCCWQQFRVWREYKPLRFANRIGVSAEHTGVLYPDCLVLLFQAFSCRKPSLNEAAAAGILPRSEAEVRAPEG